MKNWRLIWQEFRKNIDIYLTVGVALVVAILGTIGIANQSIISSAVLGTLALVSYSMLINRRENEDIEKDLSKINNVSSQLDVVDRRLLDIVKQSSGIKLEDRTGYTIPFESRYASAQNLNFSAVSLIGLLTHYEGFFKTKAKAGSNIRFLINDPKVTIATYQNFPESVRKRTAINHALAQNILESLSENYKNVQIRLLQVRPPFSLILIDPQTSHGEVQIELYTHKDNGSNRPHFILTPSLDKHWYDFFVEQFELAWEDSKPYEFKDSNPSND